MKRNKPWIISSEKENNDKSLFVIIYELDSAFFFLDWHSNLKLKFTNQVVWPKSVFFIFLILILSKIQSCSIIFFVATHFSETHNQPRLISNESKYWHKRWILFKLIFQISIFNSFTVTIKMGFYQVHQVC